VDIANTLATHFSSLLSFPDIYPSFHLLKDNAEALPLIIASHPLPRLAWSYNPEF
jgi:hypothetical protein